MKEEKQIIMVNDIPHQPAYYKHEPSYVSPPRNIEEISLIDFLRILVKRRWIIIPCVAVLAILAISTWFATPVYRATTKLQIDPEQQTVLPFQDAVGPVGNYAQSKEYLETQFKVLESRGLAERVIRALDLDKNNPALEEKPTKKNILSSIKQWFRETFLTRLKSDELADPATEQERKLLKLVNEFLKKLKVDPIKSTRIVNVSFDSPYPEIASAVANTLASQYIELNFETKYAAAKAASEFLSGQLVDLKMRVEEAEEYLTEFSRNHNIYMTSNAENVTLKTLADMSASLTNVQAERIQKESVWKVVRDLPPGNFPEILRNELITNLEGNVSTLRQEEARLAAQFNPGWPELERVTKQLEEAEKQLKRERERALQNVETEYRAALQRESMLIKAIDEQKVQVDALNQDSIQYNILLRQVETDKQLYEGILQRMKESTVSAGLQSNNVHVVDKAEIPRLPNSPKKLRNLAIGLFMGLFTGTILAFFVERLDNSINTPEDVDHFISLPSLGVIPAHESLNIEAKSTKQYNLLGQGIFKDENRAISTLPTRHTLEREIITEAYRDMRSSLMFSLGSECSPKVLLMTSSQPSEGKTTSSVNLAITLAKNEKRVLLLDADMRKSRIHRILRMKNDGGLSTYLSGNAVLEHIIQKSYIPNLYAITSGPTPLNPSELLGSQRMKNLLELLSEVYDHIIIDSPPVLAVTDARLLASFVDGVILVIKSSETPRAAVLNAKRLLAHGRLIGVLLNGVNMRSSNYHNYSGYYNHEKNT